VIGVLNVRPLFSETSDFNACWLVDIVDMSFLLNHDHDHGHHSDHHDCEQEAEEDKCQIVDEQNSSSMNRLLFRYSPAVRHDHHHDHEVECSKGPDGFEGALAKMDGKDFAHLIEDMDGYLCELAGAQIRDGLHVSLFDFACLS